MVKKLSEDETIKFVSIYRDNPCLWDITSENYKNKAMRQTALQNLCIGMEIEGFTVEDVKNKIKSLRSTYYLELDKIKKSSTPGASGNVYQPKVKWFAEFNSFIKNVMVKRKTHERTKESPHTRETKGSASVDTSPRPESPESCSYSMSGADAYQPPKRQRRTQDFVNANACDLYGQLLAEKLKALDTDDRLVLMNEIDNLVFKYTMNARQLQRELGIKTQ
ncbi:uncharacterized protein LOC118262826 isoform X2 [Spodoptera frugiperda]|uniref:Uncharacterized protein LOC118262826 isoform X2 n=1 Tax=Spodoptera frugiperda TaxID=7108 RepID=A0A9R0EFC7_SPOFR|nr:uncharacterized protein LOC118262826 isoform X2 [Spodoptera frugiperda]